jgi:hypothetical protein
MGVDPALKGADFEVHIAGTPYEFEPNENSRRWALRIRQTAWFKERAPEAAVALAASSRSHCTRCGLTGHNKNSCPEVLQEVEDY